MNKTISLRLGRVAFFILMVAGLFVPALMTSCRDMDQFQGVLPSSDFSVMRVPNVNLDVYIYAKQTSLTTVPANLLNTTHDIQVESLALWGVPGEKTMAIGLGLTFDNRKTAAEVSELVMEEKGFWKFLRENNLYVVKGSGVSAESLKTAIKTDDFKTYNNAKLLEVANMLPKSVKAKLIGMALAKPSKQLIQFLKENIQEIDLNQINEILKMANLELFVAGLYSPNNINIAKAAQVARGNGSLADLNLGMMVGVKSGLPGILIEQSVKNMLLQQGLTELKVNDSTIYKGHWSNAYFKSIPVFARIEGRYVFISVSGQDIYAETLINSIYK